ncbi:alpha/beta-hydrolase [Xylariaceae sp. FL0255]|nr:alpha/beta-hydrolase [Xylariaceae sp. FL0255]
MMAASLKYTLHRYGEQSHLQRVGVWDVDASNKDKYWIIYVHGGGWRDPRVTCETFTPTIDHILEGDFPPSRTIAIAGFASIDYRLSPHPQFPQDPATTPSYEYRNARHPDHIDDVRSALVLLQKTYGFGNKYVILGHSAGGALVFQLLASPSTATSPLVLPRAVVGFAGIYGFAGLNSRVDGSYTELISGAFGPPENWAAASPALFDGNYAEIWPPSPDQEQNFAMIASSPRDSLVDETEAESMVRQLREKDGFVESGNDTKHEVIWLRDVAGDHDEIWEKGEEVARMVKVVLGKLGF